VSQNVDEIVVEVAAAVDNVVVVVAVMNGAVVIIVAKRRKRCGSRQIGNQFLLFLGTKLEINIVVASFHIRTTKLRVGQTSFDEILGFFGDERLGRKF